MVAGRVCQVVIHGRYLLIRNDPCLGKRSFKTGFAVGVRPPKGARPPYPDRRVPYKSSIMHVVWISVSTYVVWSDYK